MKAKSLAASIFKRQKQGLFPVISEVKVRSPKEGDLLIGRDPVQLALGMATCRVAGISVVTEPEHFGGSMSLLGEIAETVDLPLLHKDFIVDSRQIEDSARSGSSAVLIISSMLEDRKIGDLVAAAHANGLEVLLEVHDRKELNRALMFDFDLLGINNRDIKVLETDEGDVTCTEDLIGSCRFSPRSRPVVSESSIKSDEDVRRAKLAGADAVLVGTAVMKARDMEKFLNRLIAVGWADR